MKTVPTAKLPIILVLTGILSALILSGAARAQTRYVSDLLVISIREARAEDSEVVGYIKSDTPVTVLEEDGELARVEAPGDLVGWVRQKYLVSEKPKSFIIEELQTRIANLEDEIVMLQGNPDGTLQEEKAGELQAKIDVLEKKAEEQTQLVEKLENELRQANSQYQALMEKQGQAPDHTQEIRNLQAQNQKLALALEQAEQNSQSGFFSGNIRWFLTGAGVLVIGMIVGRSLRRKPRHRY